MIGYSNAEAIAVYFDDRAAIFLDKKQAETFRRTTLNSPHFIRQPRLGNTHAPWLDPMTPTRLFGERRSNQNEETRATLPVTKADQSYYLEKTHVNQKGRD